jgi:hypothetical protein
MFDEQFWVDLTNASGTVGAAVKELLRERRHEQLPPKLFHFTDCNGLIEILRTRILRASLASALSDASEIKYALSRLRSHLDAGKLRLKHLPHSLLTEFLSGEKEPPGALRDARAYVTCFCAADEAIHWLHYGRSGTGVALGFDTNQLRTDQFTLCPVIYDDAHQDHVLFSLVERVDETLGPFVARAREATDDAEHAVAGVAQYGVTLMFSLLRLLAPQMKAPAFKAENEWRLISTEAFRDGEAKEYDQKTRPTHFRAANGRIVPYKEIHFDELPLCEIILGSSAPMKANEQALAVLMEDTLKKRLPVRVSTIAVRP